MPITATEDEVEEGSNTSLHVPVERTPSFKEKDVCLCIPSHKDIPGEFFFCMMALVMKYKNALRIEHRGGDSMIARSRNQLARRFLATGASWSIWFDDDMVFPFGNAGIFRQITGMTTLDDRFAGMNTIERLISWNKTMVGGCYWDRMGGGRLIAGGSEPIPHPIPYDTLTAINFVGTGCLAVHRKVYLDIAEKFPDTMSPTSHGNEAGFFTPIQKPERMWGEDESFAWRAKEAGHPSWIDLGLVCGHIGRTIHGMPLKGSRI